MRRLPWLYAACLLALAALLLLSPAEATLGSIVRLVYLHGALERVSVWAYAAAALVAALQLLTRSTRLPAWTQALSETALVFWVAQFAVSLPAQWLAWGGITLNEPRVSSAIWIAGLSAISYVIALWTERAWVWSLAALLNFAVVVVLVQGAVNILHPLSPIFASDSVALKTFYLAIVIVSLVLALLLSIDLARRAQPKDGGAVRANPKS